jgi:hypothetical protein
MLWIEYSDFEVILPKESKELSLQYFSANIARVNEA